MKNRILKTAALLLIVCLMFSLSSCRKKGEDASGETVFTSECLSELKNTENFLDSTITHIFMGTVNSKGAGSGYHYEGITDSPGQVIEGTRSEPDENGVYTGRVTVDGAEKTGNNGYSTFYPKDMSPQEVIDLINEAYMNREYMYGNMYAGLTSVGIEIDMALNDDGKIITAYPVMEEKK